MNPSAIRQPDAIRRQAADWLLEADSRLWNWDEAGDVLCWKDGRTLVFREELIQILDLLPQETLPASGALFLLLAACRGFVPEVDEAVGFVTVKRQGNGGHELTKLMGESVAVLRKLSELPESLRRSPASKANLLYLLPEHHAEVPKKGVIEFLREGLPFAAWPKSTDPSRLRMADSFMLVRQLSDLDAQAIENALRTGLTNLPEPAEVELPLGERVARLLKELEHDEDYSGMAAITREVMAALMMPRALPRLDFETPGGFSDIGNRGPLHRLLVSELAHDDDTLAARIAMNEALFLRREPVTRPPPTTLAVVIDSGVRMWGVPRVLGTAVALAALAKGGRFADSSTFRGTAEGLAFIQLDRKEGLVAHLGALETPLHPAMALQTLDTRLGNRSGELDVLLITHPNSLAEQPLLAALAALPGSCHVATVDREGNFTLQLRLASAWQTLAAARLSVDRLTGDKPAPSLATGGIPAFLYESPAPLLLPLHESFRVSIRLPGGGYVGYSNHGDLWTWSHRDQGATRVPMAAMRGSFCRLLYDYEGKRVLVVTHDSSSRTLYIATYPHTYWLESGQLARVMAFDQVPQQCSVRGGVLLVGTNATVFAIQPADGTILARTPLPPGAMWIGPQHLLRRAAGKTECHAVGYNGQAIYLITPPQRLLQSGEALHVVTHPENGKTLAVTRGGAVIDLGTEDSILLPQDLSVRTVTVLHDDYRVAVGRSVIDLLTMKVEKFPVDAPLSEPAHDLPRRWSVRTKFTHLAVSIGGRLRLRAQKGYWVEISCPPAGVHLCLMRVPGEKVGEMSVRTLGEPRFHPQHGASLSPAEWPSGSKAWLDSRGFLHLQSADASIAEITILLAESTSLPAWTSGGLKIGPPFFVGKHQPGKHDALRVFELLEKFCASCR